MDTDMGVTVSAGATVEDDPYGYLHSLILDTEFDEGRDKHDDNMHDGCKLAADVFAKISPEDYGPLLLAALKELAPEIVGDFLGNGPPEMINPRLP